MNSESSLPLGSSKPQSSRYLHFTVGHCTLHPMKILSALIKFPGKVFTIDELIEITLESDYSGYDRTIDSHIKTWFLVLNETNGGRYNENNK